LERQARRFHLAAQAQSRSTFGTPTDDLHSGLLVALQRLADASGRQLLDADEQLIRPQRDDGAGVDYVLSTTSMAPSLRVALFGLYPQRDIAAARAAIAPFAIDIAAAIHLDDGLNSHERIQCIAACRADGIIITGSAAGGTRALRDMLGLLRKALAQMPDGARPTVIYAGGPALVSTVRKILPAGFSLQIAAPVLDRQGNAAVAGLQAALRRFMGAHLSQRRSFRHVAALSDSPILPAALGLETMTAYFARKLGQDVLALDLGSAQSMLSLAQGSRLRSTSRADIGRGQLAARTLERVGAPALLECLPFHPRTGELAQVVLQMSAAADVPALSMRRRSIEYALLRAALRFLLAQVDAGPMQRSTVLLAGSSLSPGGEHGALDLLLLADALPQAGIVQVQCDPQHTLPALGALAPLAAPAVVQLLDDGLLEPVGSLLRLDGRAPPWSPALQIKAQLPNGDRIERKLAVGELWRMPASAAVELQLHASRGLSIAGKRRQQLTVAGGRAGIVFDARLSTFTETSDMRARALHMLRYFAAVDGQDAPALVPEDWLEPARQAP